MSKSHRVFLDAISASLGAACLFGIASVSLAQVYAPPLGGWTYVYDGDAASGGAGFTALDGTWGHDNGSDSWDETAIGTGSPGGATGGLTDGSTTYLRLQETGDPRDFGMPDPSNRKLFFGHDISAEGATDTILDDGVTISFRSRIATGGALDAYNPDGGGANDPWAAAGDGYTIHDGGKGNFTIKQSVGGGIAFSLATDADGFPGGALLMNSLNGNAVSGDVDTGEGTANTLALNDPTDWNEFWVTIQAGGAGTHQVSIYQNGSLVPTVFDVTAGSGSDFADISYIATGIGSTGQAGAFDLDFYAWAPGVAAPGQIPEPSTAVLALLGLIGLAGWSLRRSIC
jgi:hypothetical protein